jgi:adenylate cyclase class IV
MIEARVFVDSLDNAKNILKQDNAELKGKYKIHDTIYRNIDKNIPLIEEFLRLRVMPENIWNEKEVILALKRTELHEIGKNSHIPIKLQYNTYQEAEAYYEQNLKDKYVKDFEFWRVGWQYFLSNGDVVDLEIIEDEYLSIEFKSETDTGLEKLLDKFYVKKENVITGPSVVTVRNILISR